MNMSEYSYYFDVLFSNNHVDRAVSSGGGLSSEPTLDPLDVYEEM